MKLKNASDEPCLLSQKCKTTTTTKKKGKKERKKENTFDDPTMVLYQACGTAQLYKLASINLFKL